MKRFIFQLVFFFLLASTLIFGGASLTSFYVKKQDFKNNETESNLLFLKNKEHSDWLIMGISHARNFSRGTHHSLMESILNKKIVNIGQGLGKCGINEQHFFLDYFYFKENTVDTLLYILSPPLLYSETLPVASNTFDIEPFDFFFFLRYLNFETENKTQRILTYLRKKYKPFFLNYHPEQVVKNERKLLQLDTAEVRRGMELVYTRKDDLDFLKKNCLGIEQSIQLALENNTQVMLLIPPALFGEWEGHDFTVDFARQMESKYNVSFIDHSKTVLEPQYYYDHHHLNSDGISYYAQTFLRGLEF